MGAKHTNNILGQEDTVEHCEWGRQRGSIGAIQETVCLLLCLQLALPAALWPEALKRDLQVEDLKVGVTLWVLAVGVSQYQDPRINLKHADHDAMRIAQMLELQEGVLFREVVTKVLVNEQATRANIITQMSDFLGQAAPKDVILIFMAGHGLQARQTGTYYFVPHNANIENLAYEGLSMHDFDEAVKRLSVNVDKLMLWMDTCHSGAATVAARGMSVGEDLSAALEQASGQYVLSASKAGEESLEDDSFRLPGEDRAHGAFSYSLLRGLRGEPKDTVKVVWLGDLFSHVSREVPRLTKGKQHPHFSISGTDLPIFVRDKAVLSQPLPALELPPPLPMASTVSGVAPAGSTAATLAPPAKKGGRKWLWLLLGAAAAGGARPWAWAGVGGANRLSPPDRSTSTSRCLDALPTSSISTGDPGRGRMVLQPRQTHRLRGGAIRGDPRWGRLGKQWPTTRRGQDPGDQGEAAGLGAGHDAPRYGGAGRRRQAKAPDGGHPGWHTASGTLLPQRRG
jgi:uncharacterized caspase-like protein